MKAICIQSHNGRFGEFVEGETYEFTEYDIRPMSAVARGILRIEKDTAAPVPSPSEDEAGVDSPTAGPEPEETAAETEPQEKKTRTRKPRA